jgi:hypothetical protein
MLNDILKITASKAPPVCETIEQLEAQIKKIANTPECDKICLMIHEVFNGEKDKYDRNFTPYLVFVPIDKSGKILAESNTVGLLLPCPPICQDIQPDTLKVSI